MALQVTRLFSGAATKMERRSAGARKGTNSFRLADFRGGLSPARGKTTGIHSVPGGKEQGRPKLCGKSAISGAMDREYILRRAKSKCTEWSHPVL